MSVQINYHANPTRRVAAVNSYRNGMPQIDTRLYASKNGQETAEVINKIVSELHTQLQNTQKQELRLTTSSYASKNGQQTADFINSILHILTNLQRTQKEVVYFKNTLAEKYKDLNKLKSAEYRYRSQKSETSGESREDTIDSEKAEEDYAEEASESDGGRVDDLTDTFGKLNVERHEHRSHVKKMHAKFDSELTLKVNDSEKAEEDDGESDGSEDDFSGIRRTPAGTKPSDDTFRTLHEYRSQEKKMLAVINKLESALSLKVNQTNALIENLKQFAQIRAARSRPINACSHTHAE